MTFKPEDNFFAYGQSAKTLVSIDVTGKPVGTNEQIYVQPSSLLGEGCNAQPITPGDDPPYWQQSTIQYYIEPTPSPTPKPKPTATPCPPLATPGPNRAKPLQLTYPNKKPVYGGEATPLPVYRPDDGHDPAFFENQGASANVITNAANLTKFITNGIWDEQRIPGDASRNYDGVGVNPKFVDYATIAIGLYGCSSKTPIAQMLKLENTLAGTMMMSHFDPNAKKNATYSSLPDRNVNNTMIGYTLCQNHTFPVCK